MGGLRPQIAWEYSTPWATPSVFANFAVSTLLYELGDSATIMNLITDDAWRFPTNLGGAKVPCVISDDSREPGVRLHHAVGRANRQRNDRTRA